MLKLALERGRCRRFLISSSAAAGAAPPFEVGLRPWANRWGSVCVCSLISNNNNAKIGGVSGDLSLTFHQKIACCAPKNASSPCAFTLVTLVPWALRGQWYLSSPSVSWEGVSHFVPGLTSYVQRERSRDDLWEITIDDPVQVSRRRSVVSLCSMLLGLGV